MTLGIAASLIDVESTINLHTVMRLGNQRSLLTASEEEMGATGWARPSEEGVQRQLRALNPK